MKRPSHDEYFMNMAKLAATRGNCYRRQVGCVLVDASNHILATGYNGIPRGYEHCEIGKCPRENMEPGSNLHICLAVHAEINALMQCRDVDKIDRVYVTHSPCLNCTVVLLNTWANGIIFAENYPGDGTPEKIWTKQSRIWRQHEAK